MDKMRRYVIVVSKFFLPRTRKPKGKTLTLSYIELRAMAVDETTVCDALHGTACSSLLVSRDVHRRFSTRVSPRKRLRLIAAFPWVYLRQCWRCEQEGKQYFDIVDSFACTSIVHIVPAMPSVPSVLRSNASLPFVVILRQSIRVFRHSTRSSFDDSDWFTIS